MSSPLAQELAQMEPAQRRVRLLSFLSSTVAPALKLEPEQLDPAVSLLSYGLDSLGALTLRNGIEDALGVRKTIGELLSGIGLEELAGTLMSLPESPA